MSLKKVKQVRGDRGFRIWDLAVYAALAVIIIALFIAFVFTADSSPITSVSIVSGFGSEQHTICTYNFQTDALKYGIGGNVCQHRRDAIANNPNQITANTYQTPEQDVA